MVVQIATGSSRTAQSAAAEIPASRRRCWDALAVAALLGAIPVVHDVWAMLTAPYWLDESWVALSVRLPLRDLPVATSSSPLGWSFLLRLVPETDHLRVVPLAFHGLGVVAAYALGRQLSWPRRGYRIVAGLVCGTAVLLLPAQQLRHDLKQYSADAAVTVGLLALAAWTERSWSRRRLAALTATVGAGMLLSHVTAIVAPCVLGGLVVAAALGRERRRLVEALVAGAAAGVLVAAVYLGISGRNRNAALQGFWVDYFPRPEQLPEHLHRQLTGLLGLLGAPGSVVAVLLVAGVWTLARVGRPGTAVAVALLPVAVTTLGVARIYPLLELRTGHFLLVATAAVAGIGLAGAAAWAGTLGRRVLPRAPEALLATGVCAALLAGYAVANRAWYRFDGNRPGLYRISASAEDSRSATRYVATHRRPGDVILVSNMAQYGFAFYWTGRRPVLVRSTNTVGWIAELPDEPDVVIAGGRDRAAIGRSLDEAMRRAAGNGPTSRIWLIRSHTVGAEPAAWRSALAGYRVELVTGGVEPVALIVR